jgi:hypothetical protein
MVHVLLGDIDQGNNYNKAAEGKQTLPTNSPEELAGGGVSTCGIGDISFLGPLGSGLSQAALLGFGHLTHVFFFFSWSDGSCPCDII